MGLIHLFVHIMKFPSASTVQYDLALLEDICGHFARLKYTTSLALSFPLLKELCRFAEHAVENSLKTSMDVSDQALNNPSTMRSHIPESDGGVPLNDFINFPEVTNHTLLEICRILTSGQYRNCTSTFSAQTPASSRSILYMELTLSSKPTKYLLRRLLFLGEF